MNESKKMDWLAEHVLNDLRLHRPHQWVESKRADLRGKDRKDVLRWLCHELDLENKALVENCLKLSPGALNNISPELQKQLTERELRDQEIHIRNERIWQAEGAGALALENLLQLAETSDSGQVRRVALFIGACYNGHRHFDFYDFRGLDDQIGDDMIRVLNAHRLCNLGVDSMASGGRYRIENLLRRWGMYGSEQQGQLVV